MRFMHQVMFKESSRKAGAGLEGMLALALAMRNITNPHKKYLRVILTDMIITETQTVESLDSIWRQRRDH
jgi:hypothetical protein